MTLTGVLSRTASRYCRAAAFLAAEGRFPHPAAAIYLLNYCLAIFLASPVVASATTIEQRVIASSDDAEEGGRHRVILDNASLRLGDGQGNLAVGLRWSG